MSPAFDQAQLGVTGVGDLIEGASRATIIAAAVSGFGRIEIGLAVDARSEGRTPRERRGSRLHRPGLCETRTLRWREPD